jgi:hypothetical protein
MENSFINIVVHHLIAKERNSDYSIVLPSKRAVSFFKKEFAQQINTASFLPKIISIDEFIEQVSLLRHEMSSVLAYHLYAIYKKSSYFGEKDNFEEFLKWGSTLIQDFNEVDRYLIDGKSFFNYLKNIQDINHWSLQYEQTTLTKNYLNFWNRLYDLYLDFTKLLKDSKIGYQGLIYKTAYEKIGPYIASNNYHYFIGFNALNEAEKQLIKKYKTAAKGEIIFDYDAYYLNNEFHSAGLFQRQYNSLFSSINLLEQSPKISDAKHIEIIENTKNINQVKCVGDLLTQLKKKKQGLKNTAIVLADESLLLPLLSSLPSDVGEVNITMGVPLSTSNFNSLFETYFKLHAQYNSQNGFYHKLVVDLLQQTEIKSILGGISSRIIDYINQENLAYISCEKLDVHSNKNPIVKLLFTPHEHASRYIIAIQQLTQLLKEKYIDDRENNLLELTALVQFSDVINKIDALEKEYQFIGSLAALHRLYKEMLSKETLDIQGDATAGLQIMGMLETRVLDFETIILISANEGILPTGKSNNSFITYDMKIQYKLPTFKEKDAIYSFHFYHMLQRCKEAYIIYNSEVDALGSGERSRFVNQLLIDYEAKRLKNWELKTYSVSPPVSLQKHGLEEVAKTQAIISSLNLLSKKGFSPSTLSAYIRNPINFYHEKILGIKEFRGIEETIAANTLGTIIHNTLEILYTPFLGKYITKKDIKSCALKIDHTVRDEFKKIYKQGDLSKGKNLIIFKVAKKYIERFLNKEQENIKSDKQLKLLYLEKEVKTQITIEGVSQPVTVRGIVDRVDEYDGVVRIIDYKTGYVEQNQLEIIDWDLLIEDYKYSKAFQILMYAYMLQKEIAFAKQIKAGIISFKNLNKWTLSFATKTSVKGEKQHLLNQETMLLFEIQLKKIIQNIYDINTPFIEKEV